MTEYKDYRKKWESYPKEFKQERVSIHLDLELTTKCQLRCIMCPLTNSEVKPQDMPLEMVKRIIDEFAEKGGCSIKFVYLGEALLYPHLIEVIRYAKNKGIVDTILAINGNSLDYVKCGELINSGLDFVIFSLDSIHPRIYREIRINGNLSNVLRGLILLKHYRDRLQSKTPKIQVQAIPMTQNKMELTFKYYHEFYEPFADTVRVSPQCMDYGNEEEIGETPNFRCTSPFRRMTVRVNGDIALCCGTRLDSKIIGKFPEMSLEEAWNGNFFKNVRKCMEEGKSHFIEACKKCPARLNHE